MTIGILGTKIGMTQIFDEAGVAIPITIIKAGPCFVTQAKTIDQDGYNAIQLGYQETSSKKLNKPLLGHLNKAGIVPVKHLKEYKLNLDQHNFKIGEILDINQFSIGQRVDISGKTIGKGFASTRKRHNFNYGPMTHGSKNHRAPGSIGAGTTPGRVIPTKRMAGRLGAQQKTIKNLPIIDINQENNLLLVKGSVPGKHGNLLSIQLSK